MADYGGVPQIDFSILGNLGGTYSDARRQAVRERTLADLGRGGGPMDYSSAAKALLAAGDTEGGLSLARLGEASIRDTRDFGFRQQESQRAQTNADRSFGLQKQQADESARGYDYREVDDGAGGKMLVRIEKATGKVSKPDIAGVSGAPANPYSMGGKMNEAQSKDALYSTRMLEAERVFNDPAVVSAGQSAREVAKSNLPGAGKYYNINTPEFQKFDQAKRNFINAVLRRESGAVINPDEFANGERQYFPRPGDSKEVLAQKKANRADAIRGIGMGAGPSFRPTSFVDSSGNIVERPQRAAPQGGGITKEQYDALPSGAPYTAPDGSQRVKK